MAASLEEIWKAISASYDPNSLQRMLLFGLDKNLFNEVAPGAVKDMVFQLLQNARMEGWTDELIYYAYKYNPKNPDLLKVYEKSKLAPDVMVQSGEDEAARLAQAARRQSISGGLEKVIRSRLPIFDFAVWREQMTKVEGRVCKVEIGGNAAGTGFLVGPDAVLTNYHVLASILDETVEAARNAKASTVACRFDYKALGDGTIRKVGTPVKLHATDWKIDASPPSAAEQTSKPDIPPPTLDELDYVLIRLDRPFGDEAADPGGGDDGPRRGWLVLPEAAPSFLLHDPLMIAQHPDGKPLKLAVDTDSVLRVNDDRTRVRYATNTEPGSSGSPVFDLEWNLVALHHLGDPASSMPATYNQGVIIDRIRQRIEDQGQGDALGS